MTDNEIIKALECCSKDNCSECPCKAMFCGERVAMEYALDLINRLQADKEALIAGQGTLQKALAEKNAEIEELKTVFDYDFSKFESEYDSKIKAEAIKEFAEKLKSRIQNLARMEYGGYTYFCVGYDLIDNLVKEMVGDTE